MSSVSPEAILPIEAWPLAKIKPYAGNPRKRSKLAVTKVAASIKEFGWRQPIVVDEAGVILVGHTRLDAAKSLAMREAPVHVAKGLSDEQKRAYRIADNRTNEETEWDEELLAFELKGLDGFDLSLTGFDEREWQGFLRSGPVEGEDEVPEPGEAVTRRGDVWELGRHRVLCGDACSVKDFGQLLGGVRINLAFTSPPYAEQRDYGEQADRVAADRYVEWFMPIAANIKRSLASDGSYFLNIKPSCEGLDTELYVFDLVLAHVREWGFHFATEFCWERNGVPKSVTQRFKNQFEPVYQFAIGRWKMRPGAVSFMSDNVPQAGGAGVGDTSWATAQGGNGAFFGAAKKRRNGTNRLMSDVQGTNTGPGEYIGRGMAYPGNRLPTFAGGHEATGHVAAFPVGLPRFFMLAFSDKGDVALDPFLGSGSTLIASETEGRRCYGLEIEPRYCDVIRARWEKFTGKTAKLHRG